MARWTCPQELDLVCRGMAEIWRWTFNPGYGDRAYYSRHLRVLVCAGLLQRDPSDPSSHRFYGPAGEHTWAEVAEVLRAASVVLELGHGAPMPGTGPHLDALCEVLGLDPLDAPWGDP